MGGIGTYHCGDVRRDDGAVTGDGREEQRGREGREESAREVHHLEQEERAASWSGTGERTKC